LLEGKTLGYRKIYDVCLTGTSERLCR